MGTPAQFTCAGVKLKKYRTYFFNVLKRESFMSVCTAEEAIEEIRAGRMIILVDDEDRENEGDLTIAAEAVTPEAINFMARHGRGLICLALGPERVEQLRLAHDGSGKQGSPGHGLHRVRGGPVRRDHGHLRRTTGP